MQQNQFRQEGMAEGHRLLPLEGRMERRVQLSALHESLLDPPLPLASQEATVASYRVAGAPLASSLGASPLALELLEERNYCRFGPQVQRGFLKEALWESHSVFQARVLVSSPLKEETTLVTTLGALTKAWSATEVRIRAASRRLSSVKACPRENKWESLLPFWGWVLRTEVARQREVHD